MDVLVKRALTALVLALSSTLAAQDSLVKKFEPLSIDRPDVSNLPTTVRPGHFQFEIGDEWGRSGFKRETTPNFMFRTGINKKMELRIGLIHFHDDSLKQKWNDDVLIPSLSIKYRFVEEKGWRPAIAIQPEVALPFGQGEEVEQLKANFDFVNYSLVLLFNNTLHEKVFLNYNAGTLWTLTGQSKGLLSASASFAHTHRLGYFMEIYSIFNRASSPISFDGGLMYLLMPRIQLDLYGGNRSVDNARYWFYGMGIGFRIDPDDIKPESFRKTGIHH